MAWAFLGLGFFFAVGVKGLGGVFSIFRKTSSRVGSLDTVEFPVEAMEKLRNVVGDFVINWGLFEARISMILNLVYHDHGGNIVKGEKQGIPVPLERRLKYLKQAFKEKPALRPFVEEEREIRSKARQVADVRDFIVHGHLMEYDPAKGVYTFGRLDVVDNATGHAHNLFKTDVGQLLLYAEVLDRLAERATDLFLRGDAAAMGPHKPDNLFRRIWSKLVTLLPFT